VALARGTVRFMRAGSSMRWDYLKPEEKAFVITRKKVYSYDKDAKHLSIASVDTDRISASITFLWGQGKLDRELDIRKADRAEC
jgi:outer membrane lipoprotein carrier protein